MNSIQQEEKSTHTEQLKNQKIMELNKILFRSFFAHHPNCNQYDHHVLTIGKWRFCLGCTAMYITLFTTFLVDLFVYDNFSSSTFISRFLVGWIFFIPAIIQIFWKSKSKPIKFAMRGSLGIATWLFLSTIYVVNAWWAKLIGILIFVIAVIIYSRYQGSKQLIECETCDYGQEYESCLIKHEDILQLDGLELIRDESPVIQKIMDLKMLQDETLEEQKQR